MTGRSRNIRRKSYLNVDEAESVTIVKSRQPTGKPTISSKEKEAIVLEDIQDRVFHEDTFVEKQVSLLVDDNSGDEEYLLKKKAETSSIIRQHSNLEEAFLAFDAASDEGPGPLEMIAETGVDEEVYEDNRGSTIKFGQPLPEISPLDDDINFADEDSYHWEMEQIRKGIASTGLKATKESKKAAKKIFEETVYTEKTQIIDFDSLERYKTSLIEQINVCQVTLSNYRQHLDGLLAEQVTIKIEDRRVRLNDSVNRTDYIRGIAAFFFNFSKFANEANKLFEAGDLAGFEALFSDVLPEYTDLDLILERLAVFKERYPLDYESTFIHLQLPGVVEVFVQRQLFEYDPYSEDALTILELVTLLSNKIDEDLKRTIVHDIYMPLIFTLLAQHFDPRNISIITKLKSHILQVTNIVGAGNRNIEMFRLLILDIIEEKKSEAEPGSPDYQNILLSQSMLTQ